MANPLKKNTRPRHGVVICGAYGLENAGDDAVLTSILAALRHLDPEMPITVLARQPEQTATRFHVNAVHPLQIFRWLRAMGQSKLFISGGGSLLQNVTSQRSLRYYLLTIHLAKIRGCAVQLYGCGIGPLAGDRPRDRTAEVLNACADVITPRDSDSLEILRNIGITAPRLLLAADPALNTPASAGSRMPRIGFILRGWPSFWVHVPDIAAAVRYAYETYHLAPSFLCFSPDDQTAAKSVCAKLKDLPCTVTGDADQTSRMSLIVSMRLHGLIFALRDGVPAGGISYDPKVDAFCRDADLPCMPLKDVTTEGLYRLIDAAAHLDAGKLSAAAETLKERERVNSRATAALLYETP